MYHFIDRLHTLYGLLQDEQSKEIFQARFAIDMELSIPNANRLVSLGSNKDQVFMGWTQSHIDELKKLNREGKKIVLYGAGKMGQLIAKILQFNHVDFYGFCGYEKFPDGLLGKPVLSPDELIMHKNDYYIIPALKRVFHQKIFTFLREHNYPEDHILSQIHSDSFHDVGQYFEFPELYRRGTAFIDGGCYNCDTSYEFAKWCGGDYSSIIAFEPDPGNYAKCCQKLQDVPLPNFRLVNAGLSSQEGTAVFTAENAGGSHIINIEFDFNENRSHFGNKIEIRTVAIDDIVGEHTVGFIKMDIEGAEFDALHGAKNTIIRDKPLLAISVYHLQGDVFAIMDYLHQLLPEYRFLLRHYTNKLDETVLYASVDL